MANARDTLGKLGLLDGTPPPNPLEVLGVDRAFAGELLEQDRSGDTLRLVTKGMFRALSGLYHPDHGSSDVERFQEVETANTTLRDATPRQLRRWVTRGSSLNELIGSLRGQQAETIARAVAMHERMEAASGSPYHFERFADSRGVIVHNEEAIYHIGPKSAAEVTMTRNSRLGSTYAIKKRLGIEDGEISTTGEERTLYDFLEGTEKVSLRPPYRYGIYLDGHDGLFLYDKTFSKRPRNLSKDYLEARDMAFNKTPAERIKLLTSDYWLRSGKPQFYIVEATKEKPELHLALGGSFEPEQSVRGSQHGVNLAWDIGSRIVGAIGNPAFVKEALLENPASVTKAIGVSDGIVAPKLPINVVSLPTEALYTADSQYTPALKKGSHLLLRDMTNKRLMVTDLEIVAMLP